MRTAFKIIIAIGLYYAATQFNEHYSDQLDKALNAPMKKGEIRNDSNENSTLDDPREVAKTPESRIKQVEARVYKYAANICLLGSGLFLLLAVIPFVFRFIPQPQQEAPCESPAP